MANRKPPSMADALAGIGPASAQPADPEPIEQPTQPDLVAPVAAEAKDTEPAQPADQEKPEQSQAKQARVIESRHEVVDFQGYLLRFPQTVGGADCPDELADLLVESIPNEYWFQ